MTVDYLGDDNRFLTSAGFTAVWGTVMICEMVRKKFKGMFVLSVLGASAMAYDANSQLNAHRAYHKAKNSHSSIRDKKIALIAQTQKLVPISIQEHILNINRIRTLLENGFIPYIATINDFESLTGIINEVKQNNEIKAVWIRSDYNEKNFFFSFGQITPFPQLSKMLNSQLKTDTPILIERDYLSFLFTRAGNTSTATSVSGKDALQGALSNFKLSGLNCTVEKTAFKI